MFKHQPITAKLSAKSILLKAFSVSNAGPKADNFWSISNIFQWLGWNLFPLVDDFFRIILNIDYLKYKHNYGKTIQQLMGWY